MSHAYLDRASDLLTRRVRNPAGEDLGRVEELVMDLERGFIAYAVLSVDGLIDKLFAVPWGALSVDPQDGALLLDVSREVLLNTPGMHGESNMALERAGSPSENSAL